MTNHTSIKTVTFGQPISDLPDPNARSGYGPAPHWEAVAAECRRHPNLWVPVVIEGMTKQSANGAASDIRSGKRVSFRPRGHYDAAVRDGQLYVRFRTVAAVAVA